MRTKKRVSRSYGRLLEASLLVTETPDECSAYFTVYCAYRSRGLAIRESEARGLLESTSSQAAWAKKNRIPKEVEKQECATFT